MTPHIDAVAVLPELILTATLVVVLVVDVLVTSHKRALTVVAAFGTLVSLGCAASLLATSRHASMAWDGYVVDDFALVAKIILLFTAAVVLAMGAPKNWKGEYLVLVLASLLGMVTIVSARELVVFVVAFELLAVPGYILVGWHKQSKLGHEGALKFYLLGVVATAVMLYGTSLIYGAAGSTLFTDVAAALPGDGDERALGHVGILLVLVGIAFKISAVPFHFWAPDAYQAAPVPVAAFLAVASKAAALIALAQLILLAFPDASALWAPVLAVLAIVTMTVGNVIALRQRNAVRLMAYSSIAQAGYALVPLAVIGRYGGELELSIESLYEFLIIFAITNLAAFVVIAALINRTGAEDLDHWNGLGRTNPVMGVVMSLALLSLAGIPPLGGWFAKLAVFRSAVEAGGEVAYVLVVFAAVNTAIGLFYYAAFAARLWLHERKGGLTPLSVNQWAAGATLGFAIVITGVFPSVVTALGTSTSFLP